MLDCRSCRYVYHLSFALCSCRDHHPHFSIRAWFGTVPDSCFHHFLHCPHFSLRCTESLRDSLVPSQDPSISPRHIAVRLDRDAVATIQYLALSCDHFDEEFRRRSFSTIRDVIPKHCLPPHAHPRSTHMGTRSLSSTWGRWVSSKTLPQLWAGSRAPYKVYCNSLHCACRLPSPSQLSVEILSSRVDKCRNFSSHVDPSLRLFTAPSLLEQLQVLLFQICPSSRLPRFHQHEQPQACLPMFIESAFHLVVPW